MVPFAHMSINAEVSKTGNESALAVIRKFSRRVQGTGLVKNARKRRYYERPASKIVQKKRTLKRIRRRADYNQQVKEGKIAEREPRRGQRERTEPSPSQAKFGENTPIAR